MKKTTNYSELESTTGKVVLTAKEVACFVIKKLSDLEKILFRYGKPEDVEDAFSEEICKLLGAPIGTGAMLKFEDGTFDIPRSESEWKTFALWHARARLEEIQRRRSYWVFDDPRCNTTAAADIDDDGLTPFERQMVDCVVNGEGEASKAADNGGRDSHDDFETEQDQEEKDIFKGYVAWKQKQAQKYNRIRGFLVYEELRRHGNYEPRPGNDIDTEIAHQAAVEAFHRVCAEQHISDRDAEIFQRVKIIGENTEDVATELKVERNNIHQITWRIANKLREYGPEAFRNARTRLFAAV